MHQIANYLFFQQMLERWKRCRGWGDICAENLLGGKTSPLCQVGKNVPNINQATDRPHLNLAKSYNLPSMLRAKTGLKLAAGMERQIFLFFFCVPCVSASHSPAFPVPLPQIRHYSISKRHL